VLGDNGALRPVALTVRAQVEPAESRAAPRHLELPDGQRCIRANTSPSRIAWDPALRRTSDDPLLFRLDVEALRRPARLPVFVDRGGGFPAVADRVLEVRPPGGAGIVDAGATTVRAARIDVPPGVALCLRRIALMAYRPRA
jgi:hypothetical protein